MGLKREAYALVRDGLWATERGDTIKLVNPRGGRKLYAVRLAGSRRPEWLDDLASAKRYKGHGTTPAH